MIEVASPRRYVPPVKQTGRENGDHASQFQSSPPMVMPGRLDTASPPATNYRTTLLLDFSLCAFAAYRVCIYRGIRRTIHDETDDSNWRASEGHSHSDSQPSGM